MYLTIALHHPHPEHVDDLMGYMQRVRVASAGAAGRRRERTSC